MTIGQRYAAVQYAKECWCGQSYGKHGTLGSGHCFSKCPGNDSLTCGSHLAMQVYGTGIRRKYIEYLYKNYSFSLFITLEKCYYGHISKDLFREWLILVDKISSEGSDKF